MSLTEERIDELKDTYGIEYDQENHTAIVRDIDWAVNSALGHADKEASLARADATRVAGLYELTVIDFIPNGGGGWPTVSFTGAVDNILTLLDLYDEGIEQ